MTSLISNLALIQGLPNNVLLISTVPSHSSAVMGTQSNNSCQMYVTLATISVATREAATPTHTVGVIVLQKQQTLAKKKEKNLKREKFRERIFKG